MMCDRRVDQAALFYEFSLERHVPSDHMLRAIARFVDLEGIRAAITKSTLAVGTHSITAVYGGNTNFNTSTSAIVKQVVH